MSLERKFGLWTAVAVIIGQVIGVGIFLVPAGMAKSVGSPAWLFGIWSMVGLMTLCGALCYAELASRFPEAGGSYVYLREAYGKGAAFLYGWMVLLVLDPGLTAIFGVGFASYASFVLDLTNTGQTLIAIVTVLLVGILTICGTSKTKAKAKRAMRDMADELLRLYAERKLVTGYAFSQDAPWQHEFEDAFPYELTPDQATAIEDVKADMETARPMDRLVIGDVGYGKTEVAMRAAFKAVMDGKQVAVLAPTTILAYQHYESFSRRFAAFPAKIDLLSRFRSAKEQKEVVAAAEKGDVDVLIGTHRVLSKDVKLPKLGLVIVDEEQRFGVAHKEKLKQLKKKVDVLTLSATPIPRTLNMSLLGMRDMSVIETPPRDRLAINTQVVQFSENVIRAAIDLELARNGQVFFIHNRVETIDSIAALVQKIVPNARIAIGHGKMNEKEMEQVMLDFIDYKYDVLVATTIIENGIDIPRANTIIINRADNYGLSQLYQLRGRVGRSNRRAYAYLLIPSELELTPIARRRLSAIREFSDLGAGFRIAALDLELRGAGNILGGQQSGHLDALGFDLYAKMLERTIAELRGEEVYDEMSVTIELRLDLAIPKDFISDTGQRLRIYKRIASAENEATISELRTEIEDRYGRLPTAVSNLLDHGRLRMVAERIGVISIDSVGEGFSIKIGPRSRVSPERLLEFIESNEGVTFSPNGIIRCKDAGSDLVGSIIRLLDAIEDIAGARPSVVS
ncbi:transcription-repair coupling factor [Leptolyngbya sp. 7M]|uniref:transcription-repair coupling factor n=1 Tax=Leptolyngbya sp. 7M TaxID=2812896 RepID=UPI001B8B4F52|nr:transcription-repair coupling factor [Leptolyngbya sp. 7M]QYO66261.1 transcription-repair coupling factor [Leptolyngbya sp. 7M]